MKTSFKTRFKKALFAFFKEEILDCVEFNSGLSVHPSQRSVTYVNERVDIKRLDCEIVLPAHEDINQVPGIAYHRAVEKSKEALFNEAMKYVRINKQNIVSPEYGRDLHISFTLFIGDFSKQ